MGEKIKVSVIIPVYNAEKYLRQCLDSVVNQTLREIEIICVDDGSTDGSLAILREYEAADSRVKVLTQKNQYAGVARNNGLSHACGKYVHFLDSDDWVNPNAYEILYQQAEENHSDVCVCFFEKFDNQTHNSVRVPHPLKGMRYSCTTNFCENPHYFLYNAVVPWNKIYLRSFLIESNLKFDDLLCANDRSFYIQILLHASKITIVDEYLVYYRINNSASLVGETRLKNFDCHFRSYERIWEIVANQPNAVKRMILDITLADFFGFYGKASGTLKVEIGHKLMEYIPTMPLELLGTDLKSYHWYKSYQQLLHDTKIADFRKSHPIIVSLTSYPARIPYAAKVIESIKCQTIKPDKILLWLAESQFENKEKDLPRELLAHLDEDTELRWCEDIKPHKKYYYVMQECPDSILITIDDDIYYDSNLIEGLLASYLKYPYAVSATRAHLVTFENGIIAPYKNWKREIDIVGVPSYALCATGVGGVLYPPHCLTQEVFNLDSIKQTCLNADDLWLKVMEIISGVPVVVARKPQKLNYIDGSQDVALWKNNDALGANDPQLAAILNRYDVLGGMDTVTQRLHISYENFDAAVASGHTGRRPSKNRENDAEESRLIRASWSYRIGRFITWIPRKVRGGIRCYREHGWHYTWNRLLFHLNLKKT